MPKRSAPPKPAVEVNPQFANRPGIEVVETVGSTKSLAELSALASAANQFADLAELIDNALKVHSSPVLFNAAARIATLRKTLGL